MSGHLAPYTQDRERNATATGRKRQAMRELHKQLFAEETAQLAFSALLDRIAEGDIEAIKYALNRCFGAPVKTTIVEAGESRFVLEALKAASASHAAALARGAKRGPYKAQADPYLKQNGHGVLRPPVVSED